MQQNPQLPGETGNDVSPRSVPEIKYPGAISTLPDYLPNPSIKIPDPDAHPETSGENNAETFNDPNELNTFVDLKNTQKE